MVADLQREKGTDDLRVLLDTGSLAGDFVTQLVAERMGGALKHDPTCSFSAITDRVIPRVICSPCGCWNLNKDISFTITIFDLNNNKSTLPIQAGILPTVATEFDVLIGRDTIARYQLLTTFSEHLQHCLTPASAVMATSLSQVDASLEPTVSCSLTGDAWDERPNQEEPQSVPHDESDPLLFSKYILLKIHYKLDGSKLY